jgi:hypothetical protein
VRDLVAEMKAKHYFEDSEENYRRGVEAALEKVTRL